MINHSSLHWNIFNNIFAHLDQTFLSNPWDIQDDINFTRRQVSWNKSENKKQFPKVTFRVFPSMLCRSCRLLPNSCKFMNWGKAHCANFFFLTIPFTKSLPGSIMHDVYLIVIIYSVLFIASVFSLHFNSSRDRAPHVWEREIVNTHVRRTEIDEGNKGKHKMGFFSESNKSMLAINLPWKTLRDVCESSALNFVLDGC